MLSKIKDIITAWYKSYKHSQAEYVKARQRMSICNSCTSKTNLNTCGECGCPLAAKIYSQFGCPLDKWE